MNSRNGVKSSTRWRGYPFASLRMTWGARSLGMMGARVLIAACVLSSAAAVAGAQVGHLPERSPFRDLEGKHELTAVFGHMQAGREKTGVAPTGGRLVGFQYEWRGTQALHLAAGVSHIASRRTLIDPARAPEEREMETRDWPLWAVDGILGTALTGAKSWYGFVPMANLGVGLVNDFKGRDGGGFRFGTRFSFIMGGGVRWIPRPDGKLQIRVDLTDRVYPISYPDSYFVTTLGPPVLSNADPASRWTHNRALTVGLSYFGQR